MSTLPARAERCETCRFFEPLEPDGRCRRHAPGVRSADQLPRGSFDECMAGREPVWLSVQRNDWCGEFKPIAPVPEASAACEVCGVYRKREGFPTCPVCVLGSLSPLI